MATQTNTAWEPRNKFSANDLGDPTRVRSYAEGDKSVLLLGSVLGKITGISYKYNPNNPEDPSIALNGFFEAIPADPEAAPIRAPRFFPPNAVVKLVAAAITKGEGAPKSAHGLKRGESIDISGEGVIPLALQVGVRKTNSVIGYEYVCTIAGDTLKQEDILADLRDQLPAIDQRTKTHTLPAPSGGKVGKGKKK